MQKSTKLNIKKSLAQTKARIKALTLIIVLFCLDQSAKFLVTQENFKLNHLCNKGIAFGIKIPPAFILFLNLVIIVFLFYYLLKELKQKPLIKKSLGLILIVAGALSNLTDRLLFGCVIDYIDFKIWPVFNLADTFISIGVFIMLLEIYKTSKNQKNK